MWKGTCGSVERDVWKCGKGRVEVWKETCGSVERGVWKCGKGRVEVWKRTCGSVERGVWKCGKGRFLVIINHSYRERMTFENCIWLCSLSCSRR